CARIRPDYGSNEDWYFDLW
nr:immunoglobulin heavy chain junction region [Macaca mulatta]